MYTKQFNRLIIYNNGIGQIFGSILSFILFSLPFLIFIFFTGRNLTFIIRGFRISILNVILIIFFINLLNFLFRNLLNKKLVVFNDEIYFGNLFKNEKFKINQIEKLERYQLSAYYRTQIRSFFYVNGKRYEIPFEYLIFIKERGDKEFELLLKEIEKYNEIIAIDHSEEIKQQELVKMHATGLVEEYHIKRK